MIGENNFNKNSIKRSIFKTMTWRFIATIDTIILVTIITGELKFGLTIGLMEIITKIVLYYFHERIWQSINYGKSLFIKKVKNEINKYKK